MNILVDDFMEILIFDHVALKARVFFENGKVRINTKLDNEAAWKSSIIIAKILSMIAKRCIRDRFFMRDNIVYYVSDNHIIVVISRKIKGRLRLLRIFLDALDKYLTDSEIIFVDDIVKVLTSFFQKYASKHLSTWA